MPLFQEATIGTYPEEEVHDQPEEYFKDLLAKVAIDRAFDRMCSYNKFPGAFYAAERSLNANRLPIYWVAHLETLNKRKL